MTDYQPAPGDAMPPQPVPQPAPQPQELQKHHVHHSYIWLGSLRIAFMLLVVVFFSSFSAIMGAISDGEVITRNDFPTLLIVIACVIGGLVLIIGLTAIYQVISYKHLYYELGPEEFNLYSGILNKKRVHVPYQRIQSVDQRASLIQRIFGVCNVSIDTAGGASNKAVMVPYVQKTQAEELRRELFARKQYVAAVQRGVAPDAAAAAVAVAAGVPVPHNGNNVLDAPAEIWQDVRGVFGGAAVDTGRVTYEYGMSNKELIFTGLSNNTAFFVVVIGIVGAIAQFMSQMAPILSGSMEPRVGNVVASSVKLFGGNIIAAGVAAFLGASVVPSRPSGPAYPTAGSAPAVATAASRWSTVCCSIASRASTSIACSRWSSSRASSAASWVTASCRSARSTPQPKAPRISRRASTSRASSSIRS